VFSRRVEVLARHFAELLPPNVTALDVGCGAGQLASRICHLRCDVEIRGIDAMVRDKTHVPVEAFDGAGIPFDADSFDVVMFCDTLHHTTAPDRLLAEAVRVCRSSLVLKDHTANGLLARQTLRFMDRVGNKRHGVALPYNYWTKAQWESVIASLKLNVQVWRTELHLYPGPVDWVFGRSLHFIARLGIAC
jgi:SAM-dependent methyltransferase